MRTMTCIAFFLLLASALFAQVVGSISGIVTDENGAVVPNVRVDATNVDTNARYVGRASRTGIFTIPVPTGKYELNIAQPGFKQFSQKGLEVYSGTTQRADVKLIKDDPKPPPPIPPVAKLQRGQYFESRAANQYCRCSNWPTTP
jgi:hypothetical protein